MGVTANRSRSRTRWLRAVRMPPARHGGYRSSGTVPDVFEGYLFPGELRGVCPPPVRHPSRSLSGFGATRVPVQHRTLRWQGGLPRTVGRNVVPGFAAVPRAPVSLGQGAVRTAKVNWAAPARPEMIVAAARRAGNNRFQLDVVFSLISAQPPEVAISFAVCHRCCSRWQPGRKPEALLRHRVFPPLFQAPQGSGIWKET